MSRVTLRPAKSSDFDTLISEPLPYRVRAFTAEHEGKLLGVGGLAFQPDGTVAAFLLLAPGANRFKMALHKAGLRTMALARELGIKRVVALAEEGNAAAEPWLDRLGFERTVVDNETAWVWTS